MEAIIEMLAMTRWPGLTDLAHGGGCGCKLSPAVLRDILARTPATDAFPDLLVGTETADDAAVWRLNETQALIATTDFFMPIVDDPFDFGRIAADQRPLGCLRHGRSADPRAGDRRHADRQAFGRDDRRDSRRRRGGVRRAPAFRSPAATRSTAPSRSTGSSPWGWSTRIG